MSIPEQDKQTLHSKEQYVCWWHLVTTTDYDYVDVCVCVRFHLCAHSAPAAVNAIIIGSRDKNERDAVFIHTVLVDELLADNTHTRAHAHRHQQAANHFRYISWLTFPQCGNPMCVRCVRATMLDITFSWSI